MARGAVADDVVALHRPDGARASAPSSSDALPARWSSRRGLLLAGLGLAFGFALPRSGLMVGVGQGGGAFLVLVAGLFLLIGLPLVMMEVGLGRFARTRGGSSFSATLEALAPGSGGRFVGLLALPVALLGTVLATYVASASFGYAFHVATDGPLDVLPMEIPAYWRAYGGAESNEWFPSPLGPWAFHLAASALLLLALVRPAGLERASRMVVPVFGTLVLVLLVRIATLSGAATADDRLSAIWEPEWETLRAWRTWSRATATVLVGAGAGLGALPALGARLAARDDAAGVGFALGAFAFGGFLLVGLAPALLVLGQLGPGAAATDPFTFAFVTVPLAWQTVANGDAWATAWFVAQGLASFVAAVVLAQPLVAFLREVGSSARAAPPLVAAGAWGVGQVAVVAAAEGFLAEAWGLVWSWGAPAIVLAEVVYFGWLGDRATASRELGRGSLVEVPPLFGALVRFAVPAAILVAVPTLARDFAADSFARGFGGDVWPMVVTRGLVLAILVVGVWRLRRPAPGGAP